MYLNIKTLSLIFLFSFLKFNAQNVSIDNNTKLVASGNIHINSGAGTFTNNGVIINTEGTLGFSGAVIFAGSGTTDTKNFTIDHPGTTSVLNNKISVTGVLTVSNGTLNANNNLTLISNVSGSAVIAPVLGNINGKVTVERFIPLGKRAFRFLTPSVTTDNYISGNWQLNTHITGSTTGANGFDATIGGGASLFTYINQQTTGTGWSPISSTNATNLNALQGYRLLIRGDRTPTLLTQVSQSQMNVPITLSATGTVTTGSVTFNSSSSPVAVNNTNNTTTNGYSLIGNPYVNTLNWDLLTKSGLVNYFYSWDPNMGTSDQRGRYVAYNSLTGSTNSSSAINKYIQPGQAFFIKNSTLGTSGSLTFTESDKLGNNINNIYKTVSTGLAKLEMQVYQTSELVLGGNPIDAAVALFDNQFANTIEDSDVAKLSTGIENISFLNNATTLAIDARPAVLATDILNVYLQQFLANKNYTFKIIFSDFDSTTTPYLWDNYLNTYTSLANNTSTEVAFSTNADALSYDTNRFKIVFQNNLLNNQGFNNQSVVIYPNPVINNQFTIALPSYVTGEVALTIGNTIGQVVYETKFETKNNFTVVPKNILAQGIYYVTLSNQGKKIIIKIIKQ